MYANRTAMHNSAHPCINRGIEYILCTLNIDCVVLAVWMLGFSEECCDVNHHINTTHGRFQRFGILDVTVNPLEVQALYIVQ